MMGMTRMLFFLSVISLVFGSVPALSAQDANEYSNDRFGVSFSYPHDWRPEESAQKIVVRSPGWADNAKEGAAFGIMLTPLDYAEDKTLEEYFAELMEEGAYAYERPNTVIIDGKEWFHAVVKETGDDVGGELFLLKYNHALYVMVIAYQPFASPARFMPALKEIVNSLRLNPAGGG
jgi:hypothetical protein